MAETIGNAYLQVLPQVGTEFGSSLNVAVGNVMANVAAQATAAVTGLVKDTVEAGMGFDTAMSQVAATMGGTVADMEKEIVTVGEFTGNLSDFAKKMGAETAFSATQSAEALNYMALAGYDAETSMNMLPNVLNLAAAGSMDLARASDMVTDTQTAFGISLERTSQMVDEMAKAASTGNTSVEQLGDAFLTVGGLAQELNGGIVHLSDGTTATADGVQELEIALTAMANAGVKGTEAGTHMRNMLLKLSSPTSEGTEQLKALGVEVFDTEGKMRSLSDIFGDLDGALGQLTQEEKIQAISALFNTRDLASAEALLNAVGEDWDAIGESILDAEGAASLMAQTQLYNLEGDVSMFQSALEGLQIALYEKVEPAMRFVVDAAKGAVNWLHDAVDSDALSGFLDGISEKFQAASGILQGALDALSPPLSRIMDALGILKSLLLDSILEAFGAVGEGISANLGEPADAFTGLLDGVLVPALQGLADFMMGTVVPMFMEAKMFLNDELVPVLVDLGSLVADTLLAAFDAVAAYVTDVLLPAWGEIAGFVVEYVLPALGEFASFVGEVLAEVLVQVGDFIREHVVPAFQQMGDFIVNTVVPDVQALAEWVGEHLGPVFEGVKDTLLNHVVPALSDMAAFIMDNVVPAIQGMYEWFKENILPVLKDVAEFVTDNVLPVFKDIADFIIDHVVPALSTLFGWVSDSIVPIFDTLAGILETVVGWLIDVANHIGGAIEGAAAFFFGGGSSSGSGADVSWHAAGGIVSEATLIGAGERGAELIWPSYEPYIGKYADAISSRIDKGGITINLNYEAGADANQMVRDIARGINQYRMAGVL